MIEITATFMKLTIMLLVLSFSKESNSIHLKRTARLSLRCHMIDPSYLIDNLQHTFSSMLELAQDKFSLLQHPPHLPSAGDAASVSSSLQQAIIDNPLIEGFNL